MGIGYAAYTLTMLATGIPVIYMVRNVAMKRPKMGQLAVLGVFLLALTIGTLALLLATNLFSAIEQEWFMAGIGGAILGVISGLKAGGRA